MPEESWIRMERRRSRSARVATCAGALAALALLSACSDPEARRMKETTIPTYDKTTGKLTRLTYDRNKNGVIDTWTDMDGPKPLRSRIDLDEDGKIDRWEYYDAAGTLVKVGFSRRKDGKADAWAFPGADGMVERVEASSTGDEKRIDRWEHYAASRAGANGDATGPLVASEEDTNGDGRPDTWETYEDGAIASVQFDADHDGRPDRRLTYADGRLVSIESAPDAGGRYTKRLDVKH
jgi:hypothetical protein